MAQTPNRTVTHPEQVDNPHSVTKAQVGLGSVDNTADIDKPISTATQTALNAKEPTIAAGTTSQYWRGDKTWQTLPSGVTNLSIANAGASTLDIASDTGTDATIPAATGSLAGLMTAADKTKLDAITGTNTGDQTTIVGITGTKAQFNTALTDGDFAFVGDAPTAHTHTASEITDFNSATRAQVEAELVAGSNITLTPSGSGASRQITIASTGGSGVTNLSIANAGASTLDVASDTGTDATIPAATGSLAGLLTAADKTKLDAITGTNTGDQTSIVGISGTKAQFDTACSDGNFLYVGDVTSAASGTRDISGTSGTLVAGDEAYLTITTSNASATTLTIASAANGGPPANKMLRIIQAGAGQITIAAGTGATLRQVFGLTKSRGQWGVIFLFVASNGTDIILTGDMTS